MQKDSEKKYYPNSETFDLIRSSPYSFQFEILLLEKYYQPCSYDDFLEYRNDLLAKYPTPRERKIIEEILWRSE